MTDRPSPAQPDARALQERIDQLERERARLVTMMEVLRDVTGAVHYRDILQVVTRRLGSLFGLDRCSVFLTARPEARRCTWWRATKIRPSGTT